MFKTRNKRRIRKYNSMLDERKTLCNHAYCIASAYNSEPMCDFDCAEYSFTIERIERINTRIERMGRKYGLGGYSL